MKDIFSNYLLEKTAIFSTLFLLAFINPAWSRENGEKTIPGDEASITAGEELFNSNCKVCHSVHTQVIGPALKNVYERRSVDWILNYVPNAQAVIDSGDEYAVNLFKQFNGVLMTPFPNLKEDQILDILAYIQAETIKGPPPPVEEAATTTTTAATENPSVFSSVYIVVLFIALLIVLAMILVALFVLVKTLTRYLIMQKGLKEEEEKEELEESLNPLEFTKKPAFIWMIAFLVTAIVMKGLLDNLYTIGVQQDYAPTQPIAFSHKLHAGDYKIDCEYCHTGVSIAKNANIPSANICMNCHSGITKITGATEPSAEIQKIYDAVEKNKPIEWVRVHNLPDLAYFNHSQHYKVGGIECDECHGVVEEMEVMRQHSNLTMGWCIDCHRRTDVNTKGNAYYDHLVKLHSERSDEPLKVEDIGGLECSKCHY